MKITEVKEIYNRFRKHYDNHSDIYIYPGYDKDLQVLLDFLEKALVVWTEGGIGK